MPKDSTASDFSGLTIGGRRVVSVLRWSRRPAVRWGVFFFFAVTVGLALIVPSNETLFLLKLAAAFTVLFVLWPIIQGTYLLHKNRTVSLRADYSAADDQILGELPAHRVNDLRELGFSFVGCLQKKPEHPRVTTRVAIFIHEESGDSAQLAIVQSSLQTTYVLIFATRFRHGLVLETSDWHGLPISRPKPKFPGFRFPQVRSASDLYLLHRAIAKEYDATRIRLRETQENALANFIEAAEEIHVLNMEQGDYKLNESADHYVFTWRGAFRTSFLRALPISAIRRIKVYTRAEKKCEQLGYRINPKFGRIEPLEKTNHDG
jgi:hypothetical protein